MEPMAKKAVKKAVTMRTYGVQMAIDRTAGYNNKNCKADAAGNSAFTFVEMLVILVIFALMISTAMIAISGNSNKVKFRKQAEQFIHTLKLAQNAASQGDQRYGVMLDFDENTYALRPFSHLDKERTIEEEPLLADGTFTENFWLDYVLFDDGTDTRDWNIEEADYFIVWLMAGRTGWNNSAKIVILDSEGEPHSIMTNRMSGKIELIEGDAYLPEPRDKRDVPF
jgi:type II secretory pathway pseudopilin PulG